MTYKHPATPTGWQVVNAADAAAARDAVKLPSIIYAADTIVTNGTDVSTDLGALISTAPSGSTIQLAAGTYYAPTMKVDLSNSVTLLGVPGKTVIRGVNPRTNDTSYYSDYIFKVMAGGITIRDVAFEATRTPIRINNFRGLTDITLDSCRFTGCTGVLVTSINTTDDNAQVALINAGATQLTQTFRNFSMRHCTVESCELGVRLHTWGGWRSIHIHDSTFYNVGHAAIYTGYSLLDSLSTIVGGASGFNKGYELSQNNQSAIHIHDNTFRNIRETAYDLGHPGDPPVRNAKSGANAILVMGRGAHIHDNYIDTVGITGSAHDSEGIYTKCKYASIHDNVLINAGGNEAAIMVKGGDFNASTVIASGSDGVALPQPVIYVESTEGFETGTTAGYKDTLRIQTSDGLKTVSYTSKTENSFLGCSGGSGTDALHPAVMATGNSVTMGSSGGSATDPVGSPTTVHHNTIVFTSDFVATVSASVDLKGVSTDCRRVHMSDNVVIGATGRSFACADGGTVERNVIYDAASSYVIGVYGTGSTVRDNRVYNFVGNSASSLSVISVIANASQNMRDVLIVGNQLRNQLTAGGALTAAQSKTRMVQIATQANSTLDDVEIRNNSARNLSIGIAATTVVGPINGLRDIDNTWTCDTGAAVTNSLAAVTSKSQRFLPGTGSADGFTLQTITGAATISTSTGHRIVLIGSGGAPTLGTAVGCGSRITLKNTTASGVTIATTSAQTIDGITGFVLPAGQAIDVVSNGTNWSVI
jgi:hypothetical protein